MSLRYELSPSANFKNAPRFIGSRWLVIALFLGLSPMIVGAELHFNNGDRLTGEVILRAEGKIHFRSPLLGDLVIAESEAVVMETPETPVESLAGLPPIIEQVRLRDAEIPRPTPKTTPARKWRGKVEFGLNNQTGRNETTSINLRGETQYTKTRNDYRLHARYLYGESFGLITSHRRDASLRWRHELSEKVFTQTNTSYFSDRVTRVDLNTEQNVGMGYKFLQGERNTASVGGGLTLQYREAAGVEKGTSVLGEFFQDYAYRINGRLTFSQDLNALFSPDPRTRTVIANLSKISEEADNYKVRFNSTIQGKITDRISLNLRYEYEYDNAILNKDNRTDQRVSSSLGYSF
jgi:putative salt-induced outer membrane protein YdiY